MYSRCCWFVLLLTCYWALGGSSPGEAIKCSHLEEPTNRLMSKQCLYEYTRQHLNSGQDLPESFGDYTLATEHSKLRQRSCQPVAFYLIGRHAARYPGGYHIEEYNENLSRLRDQLREGTRNGSCLSTLSPFLEWGPIMKSEQEMLITERGAQETRELADRYKALLPQFFSTKTANVTLGVTSRIRTAQTAAEFMKQVDGFESFGCTRDAELPSHDITSEAYDLNQIYTNRCYKTMIRERSLDMLMSHRICRKMKGKMRWARDARSDKMKKPDLLRLIGEKIATKLHLGDASMIDDEMVTDIFQMCSFELAFQNHSVWCQLLDNSDIEVLEYKNDVKTYFDSIYGPSEGIGQTCSLVQDIVRNFEDVASANSEQPVRSFFHFSHDGLLKKFTRDLGLFEDKRGMSHESVDKFVDHLEVPEKRQWRSSLTIPFSSNVVFVLYRCQQMSEPQYEVMTLYNERPVKLGGCGGVLCPLKSFLDTYRKPEGCNYEEICGL